MIAIGLIAVVGIVLAVIERRRKRNFLAHDFNQMEDTQTESDRQLMRTRDEIAGRGGNISRTDM